MLKKYFKQTFILFTFLLFVFSKRVNAETDGNWIYTVDSSNKIEITGYLGEEMQVSIPSEIAGMKVVSIDENAFEDCIYIEKIVVPESVTYIDGYAFKNCKLLKEINIPDNTEINRAHTFSGCESLEKIEISENNKYYTLLDGVLYNKQLTLLQYCPVNIESLTIPDTVTDISKDAFENCTKIEKISIPESVTWLYVSFKNCKMLKEVDISDNTYFGSCSFAGCDQFQTLGITENNQYHQIVDGCLYDKQGTTLEYCLVNSETIILPATVSDISDNAFDECNKLKKIYVDENNETFYSDNGILYMYQWDAGCNTYYNNALIRVPSDYQEITFTVKSEVEYIDKDAFNNCKRIECFEVEEDNRKYLSVDGVIFEEGGANFYCVVRCPEGKAGKFIMPDCSIASSLQGSMTEIYQMVNGNAFLNCTKIEEVIFTECTVSEIRTHTVKIYANAFSGCSALTKVIIPYSKVDLNFSSFVDCAAVTIYGNSEYVEQSATCYGIPFRYINSLADIEDSQVELSQIDFVYDGNEKRPNVIVYYDNKVLNENIDYMLSYDNNFKPGTATVSVEGMGDYTGKKVVTFTIHEEKKVDDTKNTTNDSPATTDNSILNSTHQSNVSDGTNNQVGDSVVVEKAQYQITVEENNRHEVAYVGTENKKAKKITTPASIVINGVAYKVTSIANGAFKNNKKITAVVIGKNVTTIGKEAFKGCSKLKTITINSTVLKKVGKNAFKGIDKNASIKVPKKKKSTYQKLLKGKGQSKSLKIK